MNTYRQGGKVRNASAITLKNGSQISVKFSMSRTRTSADRKRAGDACNSIVNGPCNALLIHYSIQQRRRDMSVTNRRCRNGGHTGWLPWQQFPWKRRAGGNRSKVLSVADSSKSWSEDSTRHHHSRFRRCGDIWRQYAAACGRLSESRCGGNARISN
jgi:hypothetical protein